MVPSTTAESPSNAPVVGGAVGGSLALLGILAIAIVMFRRRWSKEPKEDPTPSQGFATGTITPSTDTNTIELARSNYGKVPPSRLYSEPADVRVSIYAEHAGTIDSADQYDRAPVYSEPGDVRSSINSTSTN